MFDMDTRPSVINWITIGLMALTFIVVAKVLLTKWHVPGLSELVLSA